MNKNLLNNFKLIATPLILLTFMAILSSCVNGEKPIIYESVTFENDNWNFEDRIQKFTTQIPRQENACAVTVDITVDPIHFKIEELPITMSVYAPSGSESHRSGKFIFNEKGSRSVQDGEWITYSVDVYPEKYFSESGDYQFHLLQKSSRYDMNGVKKVAVKVTEIEK